MYKEQEKLKSMKTHREVHEAYVDKMAYLPTYDTVFFPVRVSPSLLLLLLLFDELVSVVSCWCCCRLLLLFTVLVVNTYLKYSAVADAHSCSSLNQLNQSDIQLTFRFQLKNVY